MMKRTIVIAALLALMSVPALADTNTGGSNDCTGNCRTDTGGGTTGTYTNTNTNTNSNSNSNSNANVVVVAPVINNASSATGGNASATGGNANAQGGAGGNASANNDSHNSASASNGGNTVNIKNPASVGAISVSVAASGACTGEAFGASAGFTMFSVGASHVAVDPECSKREAFRLGIQSEDPEIRALARKVFMDLDAVKAVNK